MPRAWGIFTSNLASLARLGHSFRVRRDLGARPTTMLELYEFEACPFCRKVREALSVLDLDVLIKPCPKGGTRFRPEAIERHGKAMFPLLIDANAGVAMYESDAIIEHLHTRYGSGRISAHLTGPQTLALSSLASVARSGKGQRARPSRQPEQPLELWGYDVSPYSRLPREVLCELELPYIQHNIARGSAARPAFKEMTGKLQFPYLRDANTGTEMFESDAICAYLEKTYAL
jgi:glutathione S-transferase